MVGQQHDVLRLFMCMNSLSILNRISTLSFSVIALAVRFLLVTLDRSFDCCVGRLCVIYPVWALLAEIVWSVEFYFQFSVKQMAATFMVTAAVISQLHCHQLCAAEHRRQLVLNTKCLLNGKTYFRVYMLLTAVDLQFCINAN